MLWGLRVPWIRMKGFGFKALVKMEGLDITGEQETAGR